MKALVTGGGGFLGSAIARRLHARGDTVIVLGRNRYPALESIGIDSIEADIRDAAAMSDACRGMEVVFHVAALAAIWGPRSHFRAINVDGTRNVLQGCRRHGVSRLVFTSSPSVVFGEDDLRGVDESAPYPKSYLAHYPETKAAAEQIVLGANSPDLATVALRPHLIWGPGDPHLIPKVVERARKGQLAQVGDGSNLVDITYIDNAADAHVLAADALAGDGRAAGRAYFISQGEPVLLWSWLNHILKKVGAPEVKRKISYKTARRIGAFLETTHRVLRLRSEPRMTRFISSQLAKSHYFDISAAARDLAYAPSVSTNEGERRLFAALSEDDIPVTQSALNDMST